MIFLQNTTIITTTTQTPQITTTTTQTPSSHSQSFSVSVYECLTQRLVLRNSLQDGPLLGDITNGPLSQTSATQTKNVAKQQRKQHHAIKVKGWRKDVSQ